MKKWVVESEEEKWHDFDGGGVEWIMIAGKGINDVEKESYLQAQELRENGGGVNWGWM